MINIIVSLGLFIIATLVIVLCVRKCNKNTRELRDSYRAVYSESKMATVISCERLKPHGLSPYLLYVSGNDDVPVPSAKKYNEQEVVKLFKHRGQFKAGWDNVFTDDPKANDKFTYDRTADMICNADRTSTTNTLLLVVVVMLSGFDLLVFGVLVASIIVYFR